MALGSRTIRPLPVRLSTVRMPKLDARRRRLLAALSLPGMALAALVGCLALPAGAGAWEPKAPEYSISIVEGETTFPEDSILSTSGLVRLPHNQSVNVTLRLEHAGLTVAEDTEAGEGEQGVGFSQVPQPARCRLPRISQGDDCGLGSL